MIKAFFIVLLLLAFKLDRLDYGYGYWSLDYFRNPKTRYWVGSFVVVLLLFIFLVFTGTDGDLTLIKVVIK